MNRYIFGTLFIFVGIFYAVYLYLFRIEPVSGSISSNASVVYYDYRGFTNVHTSMGAGSGTPSEIVVAAQDSPADFLIFTDHNLPIVPTQFEGYHGSLLVIAGGQYSYLDSRLQFFNIPFGQPPEKMGQAQVYFTDLLSQNNRSIESGFLVLAHPLLAGYRWSGPFPVGLDGIEVLNLKRVLEQAWQQSKFNILLALLAYPLNPDLALLFALRDPSDETQLWDKLNLNGSVAGYFGSSATAKAILWGDTFLRFPSYETVFSIGANHVLLRSELTGNAIKDKAKILTALRTGQFYFSVDLLGNPRGFYTEIRQGPQAFPMGSRVKLKEGTVLHINLPRKPAVPFEIVVYRDGINVFVSNSTSADYAIQTPGNYRVVVRLIPYFPFPFGKRWISWIYSNPFRVTQN